DRSAVERRKALGVDRRAGAGVVDAPAGGVGAALAGAAAAVVDGQLGVDALVGVDRGLLVGELEARTAAVQGAACLAAAARRGAAGCGSVCAGCRCRTGRVVVRGRTARRDERCHRECKQDARSAPSAPKLHVQMLLCSLAATARAKRGQPPSAAGGVSRLGALSGVKHWLSTGYDVVTRRFADV